MFWGVVREKLAMREQCGGGGREGWRKEGSGRKDKNGEDLFFSTAHIKASEGRFQTFFSVARQPAGAAGRIGPNCRRW